MNDKLLAATIVAAILTDLSDRGGFDDWWADIDVEIQDGIVAELIDTTVEKLRDF